MHCLSGFITFGINNIWAAFDRGCKEKIQEVDDLQQHARVEIDNNGEDLETQSINTNASRFVNYRITSRNAFYARNENNAQTGRTLLVPETSNNNDDLFRNTYQSNITRTVPATARSETVNEGESNGENQVEGDIHSNHESHTQPQGQQ